MTTEPLTDLRFPQSAVAVYDDGVLVGILWSLSEVEEDAAPAHKPLSP